MGKGYIESLNLVLLNFERIVLEWQKRKNRGTKIVLTRK
jgi:hypothetical protein